ncbi:MAG TPA: SDR family oxidoreductase [Trichocoleus sp.]
MSRLVGMKSPGHNSILAELSVTFDSCLIGGELSYHVTQFDSRFSLASIEVRSSFLSGRIKAFYRPDPREQLDYLNIKSMVDENEFSGQTALVIGGSRGLGEATAKLLSAGGATVAFTYNQGEEKAQTIVSDVSRYGGQISCHYYNVLDACTFPTDLSSFVVSMSHMYYFATPSIFVGSANDLSPVLLDKFIRFYVHGFYKFVEVLRMKTSKFSIFYPSTVAIEENNVRMAEYIIAKMAGEQLGKLIEVRHSGIQVYSPRLQRLATDQTQGFVSGPSQDAASALLPLIREFSSKRGKGAWDAIK